VCRTDEVNDEAPTSFDVAGVGTIAVYRIEGKYYATSDECTHGMASLSREGMLEGYTIECSWHGGKFDVRTGAVLGPPCTESLKVFPVIVEGDEVYVQV
jgi:nitrite reductase/ring-hydroxylating ferredoxin subunit